MKKNKDTKRVSSYRLDDDTREKLEKLVRLNEELVEEGLAVKKTKTAFGTTGCSKRNRVF